MSGPARPPSSGPLVIPPPPPRVGRRGARPSRAGLIVLTAFVLGTAAGIVAYGELPIVERTFDYWLVLVLG